MDGTDIAQPQFIRSRGLRFPKRDDLITQRVRRLMKQKTYELREVEAALKVVGKDDVVLELGGGIGYVSSVLASHRPVKHVHSFEANPELASYIKDVHAANNITKTTVHNAVLGKRKGTAEFYVREQFAASSLDPKDGADVVRTEKVEVQNAKQVMKDIAPTVLVCDIEGAEVDVIPLLDLSTLRAAVIEIHPQWIGPEGVNIVFQAFMDAGLAYAARQSDRKVVTFRRSWPIR